VVTDACVYLVGAGPGDPDLLTVKARRLLERAEVVVFDRLVAPGILALVPAGVPRIGVGKLSGTHPVPQGEIHRILAGLARSKRVIVRLKGGDPFVFGRGGEEALFLARSGIRFEVVPGVTAATACAAYAGIPLTHRGLATGVRFVTGRCRAEAPLDLDWRGLADADTTLVVYMGLAGCARFAEALIAAGRAPDTPAAAVESGTTPRQRSVTSTLEHLAARVEGAALEAPVLIVVGRVVGLAGTLAWFAAQGHAQPAEELFSIGLG